MKKHLLSLILISCAFSSVQAQNRTTVNIRQWEFSRDSMHWEAVTVPHDWAISGPFDKRWDLQKVAITQNGEKKATEKSGRSGSLPWIGEGWYRTTIDVADKLPEHQLVFDGAMSEPTVYINKVKAGYWPYGYNAFRINATPFLHQGRNEIMVHLDNKEESSRWYPGAGIYRPVKLEGYGKVHLDNWAVRFTTDSIKDKTAYLSVDTRVETPNAEQYAIEVRLINPEGDIAAAEHADVNAGGSNHSHIVLKNVKLWSPESPHRYQLVTLLYNRDNQLLDKVSQNVGIRTITIDSINGFRLNGKSRKIQGVCLHHDLGPLGAAVNKAALIRQVKILKDMGADAIRTSHNMPSQMQMEVYDSLGMMVMAESFDTWAYPKVKNGYARFFKDWVEKDITNLVLANRNHPSLIMWSIGNEIPDQGNKTIGVPYSDKLQNLCHTLAPGIPVTQGLDRVDNALWSGVAQLMDVPGFNYRVWKYSMGINRLPQKYLLGSETASTISSRGVYKFPVVWTNKVNYPDGQVNGYDTEWCSWSNLPEEDFLAQDDAKFTIGQFIWTGFDYLGEPTPYDEFWPSRSSYFGAIDLAGLPKDRFYLYRSVWNKKAHTLHLLPHWTWPGREGKVTPVFCYTDYPSAELFVNGKSQGRISKNMSVKDGEWNTGKQATGKDAERRATRYRLMWKNVKYEPGELKVVAYNANGNKAAEEIIKTAGKAAAVKLESDRESIKADGEDLAYITVSLTDKNGIEIPVADDEMQFEVTGAGTFKAACNGDATSLEVFTKPQMKLFSGKTVVVVQAGDKAGNAVLKVTDRKNRLVKEIVIPVK